MPRPSFNCRYAKTSVEHAICADPVLAAKDVGSRISNERAGGSLYGPIDPRNRSRSPPKSFGGVDDESPRGLSPPRLRRPRGRLSL